MGHFGHFQCACPVASNYWISSKSYKPNRVMTSHRFSKWRPRRNRSTSGFIFGAFAHLGSSQSKCRPNLGEISQSMAEILIHPVSENKLLPCWNSSGLDFHVYVTIGLPFYICLPNFIQIGPPATYLWRHIHFHDGGHGIAILVPVSFFVTSFIWEGRNLHAD